LRAGRSDELRAVLCKLYAEDEVDHRIAELESAVRDKSAVLSQEPSTQALFCSPAYRLAALVGCTIAVFQQLTGINAIILYSSTIFAQQGSALSANVQTALVMAVNNLSVVGSFFMLHRFGRRPLLLGWTFCCGIFLLVQGVASILQLNTLMLVMTMLFVMSFEFGPGTILWLYCGEILTPKTLSVAIFLNWLMIVVTGLLTPSLINSWLGAGPTFMMFGVYNLIGVGILSQIMKETRGISDSEVKTLYFSQ
jgi:hypothetical protein